jgi:hypothetical protein
MQRVRVDVRRAPRRRLVGHIDSASSAWFPDIASTELRALRGQQARAEHRIGDWPTISATSV